MTALDSAGNTATRFNGTVALSLATNPAGDTLSGTTSISAASGVATFNDARLTRAANGYRLAASSDGLTGDTSVTFTLEPASPSALTFLSSPTSGVNDQALSASVVGEVDAYGNPVTTDTRAVTMAIGNNPAGATLSGTTTVAEVSGIATFSTLSLDKAGSGYTLVASAPGLASATSGSLDITAGAVTGTEINHYVALDGGVMDKPVDLTATPVVAWVPQADGGYSPYAGAGTASGTFEILHVPTTDYLLQLGTYYYGLGSARSWDFDQSSGGRGDFVPADAGTPLAYNVSGLTPWTSGWDQLEIYSPQLDQYGWDVTENSPTAVTGPSDGGTSWQATVDYAASWNYYFPHALIQASQGDSVFVGQLAKASTLLADGGTVNYVRLARSATVTTLDMVNSTANNTPNKLIATLTAPAQSDSFSATFDIGGFEGNVSEGNLSNAPSTLSSPIGRVQFQLQTLPYADDLEASGPNLVFYRNNGNESSLQPLSFDYGDFDATWEKNAVTLGVDRYNIQAPNPDGGSPLLVSAFVTTENDDRASDIAGSTITPHLGPVQLVRVAGQAASAPMTGVGTEPIVTWSAPAFGTTSFYSVTVEQVEPFSSNNASAVTIAELKTPQTSIRLPPGLLSPGNSYLLVITSYLSSSADPLQAPNRTPPLPFAYAEAITAALTP